MGSGSSRCRQGTEDVYSRRRVPFGSVLDCFSVRVQDQCIASHRIGELSFPYSWYTAYIWIQA
jgi:hypothetical protein